MTNASAFRLAFFGFAALAALVLHSAAHAANASGNGTAKTISPLSIARTADLDFGILIPTATGGTVAIDAQTSARTASGVIPAGGSVSAGQFIGAATPAAVVTFTLAPSPSMTLNRIGGGASMTVNQLRLSRDGGTSQPFGPNHTMNASGAVLLGVGGRLNVGPNQMEGVYEAIFTLTMDYQ